MTKPSEIRVEGRLTAPRFRTETLPTQRLEFPNYFEIELAIAWNEAGHWVCVEREDAEMATTELEGSSQIRSAHITIRLPKLKITETVVHVRSGVTRPTAIVGSGIPQIGLALEDEDD